MKRALFALAVVVGLFALAPAVARAAVLVGDTTVEAKVDSNAAGVAEAFRSTATASGTLSNVSLYVDSGSTAANVVVGVYAENSSGHPSSLLAQGSLAAPVAGAWNTIALGGGASIASGAPYWIAVLGTGGTVKFRDRCCGGGTPSEVNAQSGLTALPATWSTGGRYTDGPLSAYASSTDSPVLVVSPSSLTFAATVGGAAPQPQSLSVTNGGGGLLSWSVATTGSWLTAVPPSGTGNGSVSVSVATAGLAAGTYPGSVTFTAPGATGSPMTVPVTLTVTQPDTTPPTVSLTAPPDGSTQSGVVSVTASASDNVGVVGVQFMVDGSNLGGEDTTAPYSVSWDTTTASNGTHVLTAVASDAAGNTTTSAAVTVTVSNQAAPPAQFLVGDQTVEPSTDSNPAGSAEAFKVTGSTGGTLSSIYTYVDALSTATAVTVGIYADNNGHPGTLLTQGTLTGPTAGAWDTVAVSPVSVTAGTAYWIAILGTGGTVKFRDRCCGSGSAVETSSQTTLSTLPATWTTGASYKDGPASIWGAGAGSGPPPNVAGQWSSVISWPTVAVHMALLPTGNVISWDGFAAEPDSERLWNPTTGAFTPVPYGTNIFCSGHVLLADGRELVVGGHVAAEEGLNTTSIFDPKTNTWSQGAPMTDTRWYPTATLLGNGDVFVMGGDNLVKDQTGVPHAFKDSSVPTLPEVYDPVKNSWLDLTGAKLNSPWYPMLFQLSDGRILDAGPDTVTRTITPGTWTWQNLNADSPFDGMSAVMYRPDKIMKAGSWADPDFHGTLQYASGARTAVLDMTQSSPHWVETAPMNFARSYENLTLLPDGTVLASGGDSTSDGTDIQNAVLPAEIWNPDTQTWTTVASMSVGREYHSTALLLPDGRVLMAGGGQLPGSNAVNEYNAQTYSPPYLFKGSRPTITNAPSTIQYGSTFQITTPDAASITKVSLIRTPAVTHDFDQNQRFQFLSFTAGSGVLTVQAPASSDTAPPGYYMLFILNGNGVPSVASFVRFPAPYEDTVAPSAPGTLTATGSLGSASLAWGAATDNVAVDHYEVYRSTTSGFTPSLANRIATPTGLSYSDTGLAAGTYYYRVAAVDQAGNIGPASNEASAVVTADTTPPTVAITAPAAGVTVSGAVSLTASASDNVGVASVQFRVDGANVGSPVTAAPYTFLWDSTTVTNGPHTVTAVAKDAAGNATTSAGVSVTVSNTSVLSVLLGDQAVEPKVDGNSAGIAEAFSTTATTSGSVTRLSLYIDTTSAATSVAVGLYSNNGGHPGTLLTQGTLTAPVGGWNNVTVPGAAVTAGTTYWIAVLSPNGAGSVAFRDRCCGAGTATEVAGVGALGALPATWTNGSGYKDGPFSAYGSG